MFAIGEGSSNFNVDIFVQERLAKEKREREKQKKKERDEKLKAEGKYMTPAQKEKLRRQQALLANSSMAF